MSDQATSSGTTPPQEPPWKELGNGLVLIALLVQDALVIAVLMLSEGALHWLSTLPYLGGLMDRLGPIPTIVAFAQVVILVTGCTVHLFLVIWKHLYESYGGTKPSPGIALTAISALYFGIVLYLPHEKDTQQQVQGRSASAGISGPAAALAPAGSSGSLEQKRLPALFRLQRASRGSARSPQQFVVDFDVTEIELKTPVAYASFKIFTLVLDDQELQGYQVRNGELSFIVDRQTLPPGAHTLAVRERERGGKRTDVQTFEFMIIDALR